MSEGSDWFLLPHCGVTSRRLLPQCASLCGDRTRCLCSLEASPAAGSKIISQSAKKVFLDLHFSLRGR